jgi:mannose-6-phosphate isomerase-like protein (cupin superfamily)
VSGYEILTLAELERYPSENHGDSRLLPLRRRLGLRAFGANAWTAEVGKQVVPRHWEESGNEELYVVVAGRATFHVGDETQEAPAGTLVYVPAGTVRQAFAQEPGTIVLAVGATPGEAFAAHGWDDVVVAFAEAKAGRVDAGRAVMREVAARWPDEWGPAYNLACFEARFGDADAAFEHLRRAVTISEEARALAGEDSDLARLHDDRRWQELVG